MELTNTVWKLLNELSKKSGITEVIINNIDNELVFVDPGGIFCWYFIVC